MRGIDKTIWETCYNFSKQLAKASQKLDLSFATTPINQSLEKEKFFQSFKRGKEYNPTFIYPRLKVDTSKLQKAMESIFSKRELCSFEEIGLFHTLEKLRDYLDKKIKLFRAVGTPEFSRHSISLYGKPNNSCIKIARRILRGNPIECNETITALVIKEALEEEIKKFNLGPFRDKSLTGLDWKVKIVNNITTKVSISSLNREVLVNGKLNFTPFEIERLKVHEIDIHVLRAENGSRQPLQIFQTGLGSYQETEEGLSVYFEEKTNNLDKLQERLYAARA